MATAAAVYIELRGKLDQFDRDLKTAEGHASASSKSIGQKFAAFGSKASAVGKKMTLGLTLPLAAGFGMAVNAASDLAESISKVDVVFGKSAREIKDWSKTAAEDLGISRNAALTAAGTFGNLFTAMEIGKQPAADMSKSLVGLASDLASFNNADPTEVLESLRAGLMGEAEPMRKFGVQLSAARIEQQALNMGLAKSGEELTAAQEAQAAYAIILKDTETAQGDFNRTSESMANKQRTAKAEFDDMQAVLGKKLLPIGQQLVGWATSVAEKFTSLSPKTQKIITIMAALAAAAGPVITAIGGIATAISFLAANPIALVVAAVAGLAILIIKNWDKIKAVTEAVFGAIGRFISDVWTSIKRTTGDIVGGILAWLTDRFADFLGFFVKVAGGIVDAAASAFGWIPGIGKKIKGFQQDFHEVTGNIIEDIRDQADEFRESGETSANSLKRTMRAMRQFQRLLNDISGAPVTINAAEGPHGSPSAPGIFNTPTAWAMDAMTSVAGFQAITSGYRPGDAGSYHSIAPPHNAVDIGGTNLGAVAAFLMGKVGRFAKEIIFGNTIMERGRVGYYAPNDHWDHVHLADMGAIIKGPAWIRQGNITEAHIPLTGPGAKSLGPTIHIHGDVYGYQDFENKVVAAMDNAVGMRSSI